MTRKSTDEGKCEKGVNQTDSPCMAEGGKGYMIIRSCISRGGSDRLKLKHPYI